MMIKLDVFIRVYLLSAWTLALYSFGKQYPPETFHWYNVFVNTFEDFVLSFLCAVDMQLNVLRQLLSQFAKYLRLILHAKSFQISENLFVLLDRLFTVVMK